MFDKLQREIPSLAENYGVQETFFMELCKFDTDSQLEESSFFGA